MPLYQRYPPANDYPYPRIGPDRAHTIALVAGADTAPQLADRLRAMADRINRGDLSKGLIADPTGFTNYSQVWDRQGSHDQYFHRLARWFKELP